MVGPRQSVFAEFSSYPIYAVELYNELVNRHDHLKWAIHVRSLAKERLVTTSDANQRDMLNVVSEAILWFFAVEYYSRFLSNPDKPNNSKRCLLALIRCVDKESGRSFERLYDKFINDDKEVIDYLKIQRDKYFSHADEISWDDFPNLINDEDNQLLSGVAAILTELGSTMNLRRVPTQTTKAERLFS